MPYNLRQTGMDINQAFQPLISQRLQALGQEQLWNVNQQLAERERQRKLQQQNTLADTFVQSLTGTPMEEYAPSLGNLIKAGGVDQVPGVMNQFRQMSQPPAALGAKGMQGIDETKFMPRSLEKFHNSGNYEDLVQIPQSLNPYQEGMLNETISYHNPLLGAGSDRTTSIDARTLYNRSMARLGQLDTLMKDPMVLANKAKYTEYQNEAKTLRSKLMGLESELGLEPESSYDPEYTAFVDGLDPFERFSFEKFIKDNPDVDINAAMDAWKSEMGGE